MDSSTSHTDEELIRAVEAGVTDAFNALYERYLPPVYNRVRYVIPEEDVEDVTQEIFIAVIRSLHSFRYEARFSTWLRTLVNRHVADYYRGRRSQEVAFVDNRDLSDPEAERYPAMGPDNDVNRWDDRILLRQALHALPDHYREIILLRFADGLPFEEIARLQGQSLEATKSLFRRALAALHKQVHDG